MGNSKTKLQPSNDKKSSPNNQENTNSLDLPRNQTPNLYPQLQIRNCIRNEGTSNGSEFVDGLPNSGATCGEPSGSAIFTIDTNTFQHENNTGSNGTDGLPSYEEAVAKVGSSNVPATTVQQLDENVATMCRASRGRRHRRHHRHRNQRDDQQPTDDTNRSNHQDDPQDDDSSIHRHRHRRGKLRKHLAKIRRKKREAEK